jgi:hypothetical protein
MLLDRAWYDSRRIRKIAVRKLSLAIAALWVFPFAAMCRIQDVVKIARDHKIILENADVQVSGSNR